MEAVVPAGNVNGSWGTKVEAVLKVLLAVRKRGPTAKSLVFSSWNDVLRVVAGALGANDVPFLQVRPRPFCIPRHPSPGSDQFLGK